NLSGEYGIAITPDGRYAVFESRASNLVTGDTNGARDIFLRDRQSGVTTRVSLALGGGQGNANSLDPCISADGRFVAFNSDGVNGATERVSGSSTGAEANSGSDNPAVSADGRFVAFHSDASNLVPV